MGIFKYYRIKHSEIGLSGNDKITLAHNINVHIIITEKQQVCWTDELAAYKFFPCYAASYRIP